MTPFHLKLRTAQLEFVQGDIVTMDTDAIVNSANSQLQAGGGVCGAIFRAAGPDFEAECARKRDEVGELSPGQAVVTGSGNLKAAHVIHTVGPVWRGGDAGEQSLLFSCYMSSIELASQLHLRSISFPSISTGIYGYPVRAAAMVALPALIGCLNHSTELQRCVVVLYDNETYVTYVGVAQAAANKFGWVAVEASV